MCNSAFRAAILDIISFLAFRNSSFVGEIAGFAKIMATTISGITIILVKILKLTNSIVEMLRTFRYCD
jgi:hypothetical protein